MDKIKINGLEEMANFTFTSKYAKYDEKKFRRETWDETVTRVEKMHLKKFAHLSEKDKAEIVKAFGFVRTKNASPSMRSMQFGGKAVEAHNGRIYNCLSKETEFITSNGVKSFSDFENGQKIKVLTHNGNWKNATVKNYGKNYLYPIKIKRCKNEKIIWATKDHRWILKDGSFSSEIEEGMILRGSEDIFSIFNYENALPLEKLYWCYGYVFGDGTLIKSGEKNYSMVRLCKKDQKFNSRFEEMGFSTSSPLSCDGDFMAYTGSYLKTEPNPEIDSPNLIKAFVAGYCDADATKYENSNRNYNTSNKYSSIQATGEKYINFIRKCFPIAGIFLVSEEVLTGQITNFGTREFTIKFRIFNAPNNKENSNTPFVVNEIGIPKFEETWCLEVEDDQSFVFPFGLVTGNCGVRHIDSIRSFAESFYILLCGTGVGFGLTNYFLNRLPNLVTAADKTGTVITYVIQDTIEGWGDSVEALMNCYFKNTAYSGRKIVFDYSRIRHRGAPLKTGGGKAPGYKGLKNAHKKIKLLLDSIIEDKHQSRLKTINAYDILMHMADAVLSGGIRRSACSVIFDADDEEMMNAKTGNWLKENPQRARSNNSAIIIRGKTTIAEFKTLIKRTKEFGEPGFLYVVDPRQLLNPCFEISFIPVTEDGRCGFQFCVSGDTNLITKDGITTIKDSSNKEVEIWNGVAWSKVVPVLTQKDAKIFRVKFSDGSFLDCTRNHRFLVKKNYQTKFVEMDTEELLLSIRKSNKIKYYIPRANFQIEDSIGKIEKKAYEYGYFKGDGHIAGKSTGHQYANVCIYDEKDKNLKLGYRIVSSEMTNAYGTKYFEATFDNLNIDLCVSLKKELPKEIFSWNRQSILQFIAGWADSDGCNASKGIRIYGDENSLRKGQLLLTKIGLDSSLNLMQSKGKKTNLGIRKNSVWYLQITKTNEIPSRRLNCNNKEKNKFKGKFQNINSIIPLNRKEDVFCLEEKILHQCVFNNVLTKQCNLTSINGTKVTCLQDFKDAAWAASLIGTLQASYTSFPYLGLTSEELTKKEGLLGVSITGMMDSPDIIFNKEYQRESAKVAVETNKIWAKKIGINPAARVTCIKPEGTNSIVLLSASGIHAHHARKYFRRIQVNKDCNVYKFFKMFNEHACEASVWSENKTDDIITFPIEVSEKARIKADLTAIEHLKLIKLTQENWVNAGTTEFNTKPLNHSVSCTVIVKPEEWDEVEKYLFDNQASFTAVSLLPATGDKDYQQAPMEAVITPEDEKKFNDLVVNWSKVDYKKLVEDDDATSVTTELACGGGKCLI